VGSNCRCYPDGIADALQIKAHRRFNNGPINGMAVEICHVENPTEVAGI